MERDEIKESNDPIMLDKKDDKNYQNSAMIKLMGVALLMLTIAIVMMGFKI